MEKSETIKYLLKSAELDQKTSQGLYKLGHYSWSLFIWQLVLEKRLKIYYLSHIDETLPLIHDLVKLAKKSKLILTTSQANQLTEISGFNIKARYDDYKLAFYKKATKSYTTKWIKTIQEILIWLKNQN